MARPTIIAGGTVQAVGVYAERCEVHMGLLWIKALNIRSGHANVIGHLDSVLAMMAAGRLGSMARLAKAAWRRAMTRISRLSI